MIQTARVLLRRWQTSDRAAFAELNRDPEVMRYFPSTLTREQSDAFIDRVETHFDQHGWGLWAAEIESDCAGFIGLSSVNFEIPNWPHPNPPEIGWRLARAFWHQGYATEAARAVLEYAFTNLGMNRVVSFTAELNRPSWRVMERIGMVQVGEFEHPRLPSGHPLRPHRLYEVTA